MAKTPPKKITEAQKVRAVAMAGILTRVEIGNRLGFSADVLHNLLSRYGEESGDQFIAGLEKNLAHKFAPRAPWIEVGHWQEICLWVDVVACLSPGVEDSIRESILIMGRFQEWLHKGKTREEVCKLLAP